MKKLALILVLFSFVFLSGCSIPALLASKSINTLPTTPEVISNSPTITTETSGEVNIKIKTYDEPKLAEIIKTLNRIYPEPTIDFDGFRDKKGRLIFTEEINYYKDGEIVATITIFDGEIISIKSSRVDLIDTIPTLMGK